MTADYEHLAQYLPAEVAGIDGDYLVWFHYASSPPVTVESVLERSGADRSQVYRLWDRGFGAHLSDEQFGAVLRTPGVAQVWQDTEGRPAPHVRVPPANRIEGSYIVSVAGDVSPRAVAERTAVVPEYVFERALHGFSGEMSDAQLDRVRRDPDVLVVTDNASVQIDD